MHVRACLRNAVRDAWRRCVALPYRCVLGVVVENVYSVCGGVGVRDPTRVYVAVVFLWCRFPPPVISRTCKRLWRSWTTWRWTFEQPELEQRLACHAFLLFLLVAQTEEGMHVAWTRRQHAAALVLPAYFIT